MKSETYIKIKGARLNNLKNISLDVPRNKFVVFTGVSGSGKSTLVFDTIYAEGHRRYVESLSAYARQFLARMQKPDIDSITGLSPAIAIEQRVAGSNPRSTVGTSTEIYDYMKLLFARLGKTYSPITGEEVKSDSVTDVVDYILNLPVGEKVFLITNFELHHKRSFLQELEICLQKGFTRLWKPGTGIIEIEELIAQKAKNMSNVYLLIDRFVLAESDEAFQFRVADSVQTAMNEGHGKCSVYHAEKIVPFSEIFERDGIIFEKPNPHLFNFNSPLGACTSCEGTGLVYSFSPELVIPNPKLSIAEGCVKPWAGTDFQFSFVKKGLKVGFPVYRAYQDLNEVEKQIIWNGNEHLDGVIQFFNSIRREAGLSYLIPRYKTKVSCPDCSGTRIRKEAKWVKIHGHIIHDWIQTPIKKLLKIFQTIEFTSDEKAIGSRLIEEIQTRLQYLVQVGLGYLTLDRKSGTLSGGEVQRIKLATSLGSNLTGSLYILDEPSIGLHPRDTQDLLKVLLNLRDMGNSVLVVEHDEMFMQQADFIVDMGPLAGEHGGEVCFAGEYKDLTKAKNSLTADYLTHKKRINIPKKRRKSSQYIRLANCRENNLKNISVTFPLKRLTVVTGVSGSGKTSLIRELFFPAVKSIVFNLSTDHLKLDSVSGDLPEVKEIEFVDQNALTASSRSNPVTYLGIYDYIRELMANKSDVRGHGWKSSHFSFNVEGGRCDACEGDGHQTISMQFMPDVKVLCEVCEGQRFKKPLLEVTFRQKNIFEILQMTVLEAINFFTSEKSSNEEKKIVEKLSYLEKVGLEYLRLGQTTASLSGGEAQRLKLAAFLDSKQHGYKIFIFDEPTTGLHVHDIQKLLLSFQELVDKGNTVIVVEHNLDIIQSADWIIDLGPEGGDEGGHLVFAGTPEELISCQESWTAKYLADKWKQKK